MDALHLRRGPLLLSPPTALDAPRIAELCQDAEIQRWTFVPSPYAQADAEYFVRNVVGPGWDATSPTWAVRLLDAADVPAAGIPAAGSEPGSSASADVPSACGEPADTKPADTKPADTKPTDTKPADTKPADTEPAATTTATRLLDLPVERFSDATLDPGLLERSTLHGMVSLTDRGAGEWEIGYWLGPGARGRGLMTGAVDALLDVAADVLGAQVVTWKCLVRDGQPNWASWRVPWRLGFRLEGAHRLGSVQRGERRDGWTGSWLPGDPRRPVEPWTGPVPLGAGMRPPMGDPREPEALVRQFHEIYGLPVTEGPANVDVERVHLRMGLIAEEFAELAGACYGPRARRLVEEAWQAARASDDHARDTVEVADALADLVYVIYGMALETGIPLHRVLAEVHGGNLAKLGADGRPIYRADGKVLKGPAYHRPDVAAVLEAHARRVAVDG